MITGAVGCCQNSVFRKVASYKDYNACNSRISITDKKSTTMSRITCNSWLKHDVHFNVIQNLLRARCSKDCSFKCFLCNLSQISSILLHLASKVLMNSLRLKFYAFSWQIIMFHQSHNWGTWWSFSKDPRTSFFLVLGCFSFCFRLRDI